MELAAGQHAFITGGASGLGLGIADALAARGLKITIADIQADLIDEVLASRGEGWRGVVLDVRDRDGWARARAEAEAAFGPVDVLVNNAGIAPNGKPFAEMPPESFDQILAINLGGVFNGVHTFALAMRERGRGHIVNTSSMAGLSPSIVGIGAYATAKFGVTAMTESLRKELADHGVGVTLLCPGFVLTGLGSNTAKLGGLTRSAPAGAALPPSGVSSDDVGAMVVEAIEGDEPCIVTHAGSWPEIGKRFDVIRAACDKADARGLGAR
jgi:NAD(P)-dependent dehydrogenase (short-subunit alcohol dehydrogenase family)